ncbi:GldG family protein [Alkalilimnicola ehrlichii]|uniref:GldG family protein n=1 Tax=Alkalilimnicola ehrlichii TaxID=351052 RepID=UPI003B9E13B1
MRMNPRTRWLLRLNAVLFTVATLVALAALGWMSQRFVLAWDWSGQHRAGLSEQSVRLLEGLETPPRLTAFVTPGGELADQVERLARRYRGHRPDLVLETVDPRREPDRVRRAGVDHEGELLVELGERRERAAAPTEAHVSRALERLLRERERRVAWLTDHGQRDLQGQANHDLGRLGEALAQEGHHLQGLSLLRQPLIPENTDLLVLAGPQVDLLEGERRLLRRHVAGGGNLLWLLEPEDLHRLPGLAADLGVTVLGHPVRDPRTQELLGTGDPGLSLVDEHPAHPVMEAISGPVLLPYTAALAIAPAADDRWRVRPLLRGAEHHELDAAAEPPFLLGATLERPRPHGGEQRVAIIGGGDFLSNRFLGNAANRSLGLALADWLTDPGEPETDFTAPGLDQRLDMGPVAVTLFGFGFLIGLPALLALVGGLMWWRGRR